MAQLGTRPINSDSTGTGLCLHPPGLCPAGASCSTSTLATASSFPPPTIPSVRHRQHQHQHPPQPLPVLHGGSVLATSVTEMQMRVVLSAARREVERLAASFAGRCYDDQQGGQELGEAAYGDTTRSGVGVCPGGAVGMSTKGSLRRFLEKRRIRLREASASPYGCSTAR